LVVLHIVVIVAPPSSEIPIDIGNACAADAHITAAVAIAPSLRFIALSR